MNTIYKVIDSNNAYTGKYAHSEEKAQRIAKRLGRGYSVVISTSGGRVAPAPDFLSDAAIAARGAANAARAAAIRSETAAGAKLLRWKGAADGLWLLPADSPTINDSSRSEAVKAVRGYTGLSQREAESIVDRALAGDVQRVKRGDWR